MKMDRIDIGRLNSDRVLGLLLATIGLWTVLTIAFSAFHHQLTPLLSVLGLITALALLALGISKSPFKPQAPEQPQLTGLALVCLGLWVLVNGIYWLNLIGVESGYVWVGLPANQGDLPLHLSFIEFFRRGGWWTDAGWLHHPLLVGEQLGYPIGSDFWVAMLEQIGLPLLPLLQGMGFLASLVLGWLLYRWGGVTAVLGFMLLGAIQPGLVTRYLGLPHAAWPSGAWPGFSPYVSTLPFLGSLWLTQRGLLFAIPIGLLLLLSWKRRYLEEDQAEYLPWWLEGVLWGVLPTFHAHTFFVISITGLVWVLQRHTDIQRWRMVMQTAAVGLLPAAWMCWNLLRSNPNYHGYAWQPGWQASEFSQTVTMYLLQNFHGWLLAVVLVWLWVAMSRQERASRTHKILCITGTSWLVVSMCLMINPWSWDNIKLLFWGFVLLWPVMNSALQQGWQVAKQRSLLQRCGATAVAGLLLFALLWPGVTYHLDLIGRAPSKIAKVAEWQAVCEQVRQLPVNTRLAIAPIQTHPVLLCGQPVVISFPRHIETHGYSPHRAMGILKGVFGQGPLPKGPWTAEIAGLYWGEREKSMVERGYFYGPIGYCGQEMPSQSVEWGRIILLQQR